VVASASGLWLLLGNGNGTFQPGYRIDPGVGRVTVGDFNNDGNMDLVLARENGLVSLLLGTGQGTFQSPQNYVSGVGSQFTAMGDFNGDGFPDLAVTGGLNGVGVMLNTGVWPAVASGGPARSQLIAAMAGFSETRARDASSELGL
jgi:hypothetical protein